jgi:hypothetical protein
MFSPTAYVLSPAYRGFGMCVRVQHVSSCTFIPYDGERNVINVPAELDGPYILKAVRKVLSELGTAQPCLGAVCWCGEPVPLLARVTQQRENGDQVVTKHGA